MKQQRIYFLIGMMISMTTAYSQHQDSSQVFSVDFSTSTIYVPLEEQLSWWEDSTSRVQFEEANQQDFRPYSELDREKLIPGATFWGKLSLVNPEIDSAKLILSFGSGDTVECFVEEGGKWSSRINGANIRVSKRELVFWQNGVFKFHLGPKDTLHVVYRSREFLKETPVVQASLYSPIGLSLAKARKFQNEVGPVGMFQAILLIMLLYNFMIFITTRHITYFWYALYLFSLLAALYFDNTVRIYPEVGFDSPWLSNFTTGFMLSSTSLWYFLFGRSFLNSKVITPTWDKAIVVLIGVRVLFLIGLTVSQLLAPHLTWAFGMNQVLLGIEILFLVVYFFRLAKVGGGLVWFFIVGSGVVFIFGFLQLVLRDFINLNTFMIFLGSVLIEILIFSLGLGYRMRKSQQDKLAAEQALNLELSKINTAFGRFVPHEFLQILGKKDVLEVSLGDQVEREVTVLFSDIRSYTTLSEKMTPKENFDFLNGYLGRVGPVIQENQGFVNQYYGDGMMALFMGKPENAVKAAIATQLKVSEYNRERIIKGRSPIRIGIGLHTGPLMMGVIGDTLRMDAGVVSDSVNIASRMEGLTKQFGVNILMSETVRLGLTDSSSLRSLGKVLVKGKTTPLHIYECYDGDSETEHHSKATTTEQHERALNLYHQKKFAQALEAWDHAIEVCPDDPVLLRFQESCRRHLIEGVPEEWSGVEEMMEK